MTAPTPIDPLIAELQAVQTQSRGLSRAIGQAKKANQSIEALLEEKRTLTRREKALENQISRLRDAASQSPAGEPSAPPSLMALAADPSPELGPVTVGLLHTTGQYAAWDAYVNQHPNASIYHLSGWRGVCVETFGHDCPYLIAHRGDNVVGVLPLVRLKSRLFGHFLVSVPYFNYGGALASDGPARQALLQHATELARTTGCSHLELRDRQPMGNDGGGNGSHWPARTDKVSMWLKLPHGPDALWQQIGSKVRAQVKKAQSHGLQFETGGIELLDDFYTVFAINMRDLGTPVYGRGFFETILRQGPGNPTLVIGRTAAGKVVAASFLLSHAGQMEVPWASTLRSANALNANMGLYWHMLEHACKQGCHTFDFGRSTEGAPTYRFKKQWGAKRVPLYWHYWLAGGRELPRLNPDNPKYRLVISAWQRTPIALTNLIGPRLSKYLP